MGHFLVYEGSRSVKYDTLSVMASSDGGQNLHNSLISKVLVSDISIICPQEARFSHFQTGDSHWNWYMWVDYKIQRHNAITNQNQIQLD